MQHWLICSLINEHIVIIILIIRWSSWTVDHNLRYFCKQWAFSVEAAKYVCYCIPQISKGNFVGWIDTWTHRNPEAVECTGLKGIFVFKYQRLCTCSVRTLLQIPAGSRPHQGGSPTEEPAASWPLTDCEADPRFRPCSSECWVRRSSRYSWQRQFTKQFCVITTVLVINCCQKSTRLCTGKWCIILLCLLLLYNWSYRTVLCVFVVSGMCTAGPSGSSGWLYTATSRLIIKVITRTVQWISQDWWYIFLCYLLASFMGFFGWFLPVLCKA